MKSQREWDALDNFDFHRKCEKTHAKRYNSGKKWRSLVFLSPAFAACAGLVENGHADRLRDWTYRLFDIYMSSD